MKEITMYESSDGERFETEEECRAHEELVDVDRIVGEYVEQLPEKIKENPRSLARRANVSRDFLRWYLRRFESLSFTEEHIERFAAETEDGAA